MLSLRTRLRASSRSGVIRVWTIVCLLVLSILFLRYPWIWTDFLSWFWKTLMSGVHHPHPYQIAPGAHTTTTVRG